MGKNEKQKYAHYEVIVGNIGSVYSGKSASIAHHKFNTYVKRSVDQDGRVAGESVTMLGDGEPCREFDGSNDVN